MKNLHTILVNPSRKLYRLRLDLYKNIPDNMMPIVNVFSPHINMIHDLLYRFKSYSELKDEFTGSFKP